jgi:hypothetical protein
MRRFLEPTETGLLAIAVLLVPARGESDERLNLVRNTPAAVVSSGEAQGAVDAIIRINDAGIASWKYLNRRSPPHLLGFLYEKRAHPEPPLASSASNLEEEANVRATDQNRFDRQRAREALIKERDRLERLWIGRLLGLSVPGDATLPPVSDASLCASLVQIPSLQNVGAIAQAMAPEGPAAPKVPNARVVFKNTSASRDVVVTLSVPTADSGVCEKEGVKELGFEATTDKKACSASVRIARGATEFFPICSLLDIHRAKRKADEAGSQPASFSVAFFPDDLDPGRSTGEFLLVPGVPLGGPTSSIATTFDVSAQYYPDLDLGRFAEQPRDTVAFSGERDLAFPFGARVVLDQAISRFAQARVALEGRKGQLGDGVSTVTASSYYVRTYGVSPFSLQLGKFPVSIPGGGIAISETGDTVRLGFKDAGVSYLLRRQRNRGKKPSETLLDRDSAFVLETGGLPILTRGTFSAVALMGHERGDRGQDDTTGVLSPHKYQVIGGSASYPWPYQDGTFSGTTTFSRYWARRFDTKASRPGGKGTVWYLQNTLLFYESGSASSTSRKALRRHSVQVNLGRGSVDNTGSNFQDESYIGERQAFAPDELFLKLISATQFRDKQHQVPAAGKETADPPVTVAALSPYLSPGLTGKQYLGVMYQRPGWSPLRYIARLLREDTISAEATDISFHVYEFREPVNGAKSAGKELTVRLAVEAPTGLKWSLTGARFFPGGAVKEAFRSSKSVWAVKGGLSVTVR